MMKKILLLTICLMMVGCVKKKTLGAPETQISDKWSPSNAFMAQHIERVHHVVFDEGFGADVDITVRYEEGQVWVLFNEDILKETNNEITEYLNFEGREQYMSQEDYIFFLNKLHAYLLMKEGKTSDGYGVFLDFHSHIC